MKLLTILLMGALVPAHSHTLLLADPVNKNAKAGQLETLAVHVLPGRPSYGFDEPIELSYFLKNTGRQPVPVNIINFVRPASLLIVKAPNGTIIASQAEWPFMMRTETALVSLGKGEFHGLTIDMQAAYPDRGSLMRQHSFDTPGVYEITGVYENKEVGGDQAFWTGRITSAPVKIEIRPLSPQQLGEVQKDLRSGAEAAKTRAVKLVRKVRLGQFVGETLAILDSAASLELRREAANTLFDLPDKNYYEIYLKHLKSPDSTISGLMALILGEKLKDSRAVPALMEAADAKRAPEAYRPALRALIEIGDPQALPVIRKIAENDPSEEIRNYAAKAAQEMQAIAAGRREASQ